MPQLEMIPNICPKCSAEFTAQRTHYCRELLRYQRENYAQRGEINALEAQLKHALQKLLNAERRYDNLKHQSQPQKPVAAVGEVIEIGDNGFKCEFSQLLAIGTKLYTAAPCTPA